MDKIAVLITGLAALALAGADAAELPPLEGRTNLAAGRPVVFAPAPNYRLTHMGNSDATDLTDGKVTRRKDRHIWFDADAVGWSYGGRVNLGLDLGRACRIDEIAIRLLGGSPQAGINFPGWIEALVSRDGEHYVKVGELSRWRPGDLKRFGVPDDQGKGWIHCVRFEKLAAHGRWVALRMYVAGVSASDEMYVFGTPAELPATEANNQEPSDFTIAHPQPYFHKPELVVATNASGPVPIGVVVPEEKRTSQPLEMTIDLPEGVEFLAGKIDKAKPRRAQPEITQGGRRFRLTAAPRSNDKALQRLYIQASGWKDGQTGSLRYQFTSGGWQSPVVQVPIRSVELKPVPRPKRFLVGLGWWSASETAVWPHALDAWERLGLNSFPLFAHWTRADDPLWNLVEEARRRGFFIVNIDSPFHRLLERRKNQPEIYHQFADGTVGKQLCPSYRGPYYQEEIERFGREMGRAKPNFASLDIELWGWQGPQDSRKCTRCQKDFQESGLKDWKEWMMAKGEQMWRDLATAARSQIEKAGGPPCDIGGYDFRPGPAYQGVWSVDRLYPKWMQSSQVSTYSCLYPYHLCLIGDDVRQDRSKLAHSDVLPWLSPGDAGTFPGECFQWALLECYLNGARGVYFWSSRVWDIEDLIAYHRVVRALGTVEQVIVDGQLVGAAASVAGLGRVSGMRCGNQMVLLVADYFGRSTGTVSVRLDVAARSEIRDLLAQTPWKKEIGAGNQLLQVPLEGARARLLHVRPLE
jgi:hypothetical protein